MIKSIKEKPTLDRLVIDLTGPDGNVFNLISMAMDIGKKINKVADDNIFDTKKIVEEMMSSDYENAVKTFDRYFGEYVILYR